MRHIEHNGETERQSVTESTEEQLRREIEGLKRQIADQKSPSGAGHPEDAPHPSSVSIWLIALGLVALLVAAFFTGYLPYQKRETTIRAEARDQEQALPIVKATKVVASPASSELVLPGNIEAVTEAPILARADGYLKQRFVDIGDSVKANQPLAEIDAPELDHQVHQATATVQQMHAALDLATANYEQGKANADLARVTAQRWANLAESGVVSKQDNDQYQAQYQAQTANLQALDKAIAVARSNITGAESNLARLVELQRYKTVRAPFDGVVTVRNVDVGALISTGSTLLFRVAQTGIVRTYVNVPQADAESVRVGQPALLTVSNIPGRKFKGTVTRTSGVLDPSSRTLLLEVQIQNGDHALAPGMYALVDLNTLRRNPPALIPGDALVVRADGPQVARVGTDHTVHFQKIQIGRDYGDRLEVLGGVEEGDLVISTPSDAVREGAKVNVLVAATK